MTIEEQKLSPEQREEPISKEWLMRLFTKCLYKSKDGIREAVAEEIMGKIASSEQAWRDIAEGYREEMGAFAVKLDQAVEVLKWYGGGSEDGGDKARDFIASLGTEESHTEEQVKEI